MVDLETALQIFCDYNLRPGMAYGDKEPPTDPPEPNAVLMYRDGTACSASYALSDVYKLATGKYVVQTRCGVAHFTGDSPERNEQVYKTPCANLVEVVQELANFCGHDANSIPSSASTGEMLCKKTDVQMLNHPEAITQLIKGSVEGQWRHNKDPPAKQAYPEFSISIERTGAATIFHSLENVQTFLDFPDSKVIRDCNVDAPCGNLKADDLELSWSANDIDIQSKNLWVSINRKKSQGFTEALQQWKRHAISS